MTETRVAVVTGASRGIGAAVALALARAGFDLLLAARTGTALETVASRLSGETGRRAEIVPCDLREPEAAERVVQAALDAFGRIDLLVNNAGATKRGAFLELGEADWQDGYALKLFGCVRLCRAA
jgi:3-oxoacyl-[acyl-carrier protein] reductase